MKLHPGMCVRDKAKDAIMCDALADGMSVAAAGRLIGVGKSVAHVRFKRICGDLGEQAR